MEGAAGADSGPGTHPRYSEQLIDGYLIVDYPWLPIGFNLLLQHFSELMPKLMRPRSNVRWLLKDGRLLAFMVFEDTDEPLLTHIHLWMEHEALRAPETVAAAFVLRPPFPDVRYYVAWIPLSKRGARRLALLAGFKPTGRTPFLSERYVVEYLLDTEAEREHPSAWWSFLTTFIEHR